jgi:hypothetical protein
VISLQGVFTKQTGVYANQYLHQMRDGGNEKPAVPQPLLRSLKWYNPVLTSFMPSCGGFPASAGTSRQGAAAAATAALPRQLTQQQQQPLYDSYTYSYSALPVTSGGGGISSSSYSQVGGPLASATAMGHAPTCLALAGGMCSCWAGNSATAVQAYSVSAGNQAGAAAAVGGYVNCPDGSLQPAQLQPWQQQQQMGDAGMYGMDGVATTGDVAGSPFMLFGGGSSCTRELAGSSTKLQSAGGAATAPPTSGLGAQTNPVCVKSEPGGNAAGAVATQQHDQQQPSSSSMSSGSPVRPGLVGGCGNVTPPPAGSMDRAHRANDAPAASSRSTVMGLDTAGKPSTTITHDGVITTHACKNCADRIFFDVFYRTHQCKQHIMLPLLFYATAALHATEVPTQDLLHREAPVQAFPALIQP